MTCVNNQISQYSNTTNIERKGVHKILNFHSLRFHSLNFDSLNIRIYQSVYTFYFFFICKPSLDRNLN